jgi:hypothetical protein
VSVKSFEKGTITLPAYCGKPSMPLRKGTEPGTVDAESMPMMPSIAARPLRISHLRPRSFCSAVRFVVNPKGSQRLRRKWPPGPPLPAGTDAVAELPLSRPRRRRRGGVVR